MLAKLLWHNLRSDIGIVGVSAQAVGPHAISKSSRWAIIRNTLNIRGSVCVELCELDKVGTVLSTTSLQVIAVVVSGIVRPM